jgi:hypothetical protein
VGEDWTQRRFVATPPLILGQFLMFETGPSNPAHEDRVLADRILPSLKMRIPAEKLARHASLVNRSVGAFLPRG